MGPVLYALFAAWFFGISLEIISGTPLVPRAWWLYNKETAACIICTDSDAAFVIPNGAYASWMAQANATWRSCKDAFAEAECDRAYRADYNLTGKHLRDLDGNPYEKALERFRMATEAKNRDVFWNLTIGAVLHALSILNGFIFFMFMYVSYQENKEKSEREGKEKASKTASAPTDSLATVEPAHGSPGIREFRRGF